MVSSTLMGIPLKYISLAVLVIQNTLMVLFLRASRTAEDPYISSTAILSAEFLKLFTCLFLVFQEEGKNRFIPVLREQIFGQGWDSFKIFVPACLYVIQNNLLFIALSNLDVGTYQVTYQLKILTTAIFSVFLLQKQLNLQKWGSLFLLTVGVSLVQLSFVTPDTDEEEKAIQFTGLVCVIGACLLSGLAGVYFEKVLKFSKPSVWVRNIQLSLFSIIPAFIAVFWTDGEAVMTKGFFYGYSPIVWIVVILQACSGLIIALVVKHADNILKGFATSISIICSSVVSMFLFAFVPSFQWICGTLFVISSTIIYSFASVPPPPSDILPTKQSNTK